MKRKKKTQDGRKPGINEVEELEKIGTALTTFRAHRKKGLDLNATRTPSGTRSRFNYLVSKAAKDRAKAQKKKEKLYKKLKHLSIEYDMNIESVFEVYERTAPSVRECKKIVKALHIVSIIPALK